MYRPALLVFALSLGGCVNLAPDYRRPEPALPVRPDTTASAAELQAPNWHTLFREERLARTVDLALQGNRDVRVIALQVEQVRALFQQTQAQRLPALNASTSASHGRNADGDGNSLSLQLALASYELDVFGRVRNLNASAAQTLLGAAHAHRSAQIALAAETASTWLHWSADLERQRLARQTLESQERALELTKSRHAAGSVSSLVLAQAETAALTARAELAAYPASIAQHRHALELLLGAALPPGLEPRAADVQAATSPTLDVPAGVPSSLLQRRPDVLAAEHALIARHADIGVARAARFPSISLTANAGLASTALSGLFKAGSSAWAFGPSVSLPLFDGGARAAQLRQAEVGRDIALAAYDRTLQIAFREVADALAVRATLAERMAVQQALLDAAERQVHIAEARLRAGSTSQLDLLDAQRAWVAAQQGLVTLRLGEQINRIQLGKALGGGWRDVPGT